MFLLITEPLTMSASSLYTTAFYNPNPVTIESFSFVEFAAMNDKYAGYEPIFEPYIAILLLKVLFPINVGL
jgi:hypothetical protein